MNQSLPKHNSLLLRENNRLRNELESLRQQLAQQPSNHVGDVNDMINHL